MTLLKQRNTETDEDFAQRVQKRRELHSERNRKYREANPEAVRESKRKYYEANKEASKEKSRRYYEANKEALREYGRKYREANREAIAERERKKAEAKALKNAKGRPLRSNYRKAARPKMLTRLIIEEAKAFCLEWGFTADQAFDADVLKNAARAIRDNPFYPVVVPPEEFETFTKENGITEPTNPWYGTDYLHEATLSGSRWGADFRRVWQKRQ